MQTLEERVEFTEEIIEKLETAREYAGSWANLGKEIGKYYRTIQNWRFQPPKTVKKSVVNLVDEYINKSEEADILPRYVEITQDIIDNIQLARKYAGGFKELGEEIGHPHYILKNYVYNQVKQANRRLVEKISRYVEKSINKNLSPFAKKVRIRKKWENDFDKMILEARTMMEEGAPLRKVTLQTIADRINVSKSYVAKVFGEVPEIHYTEFLNEIAMAFPVDTPPIEDLVEYLFYRRKSDNLPETFEFIKNHEESTLEELAVSLDVIKCSVRLPVNWMKNLGLVRELKAPRNQFKYIKTKLMDNFSTEDIKILTSVSSKNTLLSLMAIYQEHGAMISRPYKRIFGKHIDIKNSEKFLKKSNGKLILNKKTMSAIDSLNSYLKEVDEESLIKLNQRAKSIIEKGKNFGLKKIIVRSVFENNDEGITKSAIKKILGEKYSEGQIRHQLKKLVKERILIESRNLLDMRSKKFFVNPEYEQSLFNEIYWDL